MAGHKTRMPLTSQRDLIAEMSRLNNGDSSERDAFIGTLPRHG